jgi:phage minor structural protein
MLKVLDKNLIPLGVLPGADDVQRKRRINSDYEISFLVPMNSADYMEKITLKGHVQDERGQYYVIDDRQRVRDGLKRTALITCTHIMFKLQDFKMPYESYIEEGFGVNITTLTNSISSATGGKFTFVIDDVFDLKDIKDFGRGNCLQALNTVVKEYAAEIDPNNFAIHVKKKIGVDSGLQYRFKKNIVGNTFKDSTRALVTRMFAQMKDGLTFIGLPSSVLTAQELSLLNAVPGAIVSGVIKVNYLISQYAAAWSNNTNTYFDGELIDQNIEDQMELLNATREALKKQEVPTIDVTIDAADLFKIDNTEPKPGLGDTVYLIDQDMELNNMTARIMDLTEYPYNMDKHTQPTLANYLRRDLEDIIADLDRSKQIVNDIVSGAKIRTTVFEAFAKQAIYDINNSKTEVKYDQRGIVLQDKNNAQNQVVMSSNGVYLTTNGGADPRWAMTANGIVAEVIVGILGQFAQVKTDNLIAGNALIRSALIESLKVEKLDVSTAKITSAMIDKITANQIDVSGGKIIASQIDATNLNVAAANITGLLNANQINATNLHVNSANIDGTIIADIVRSSWVYTGTLTAQQVNAVAISADSITAGSLTGRTVRTAASGYRLEMNSSGIQSYNSSNQLEGAIIDSSNFSFLDFYYQGQNRGGIGQAAGVIQITSTIGSIILQASSGSFTRLRGDISFEPNSVSGLTTSMIAGLEARLQYLEDHAFVLSYRGGTGITFNSKNVAGVDVVPDAS